MIANKQNIIENGYKSLNYQICITAICMKLCIVRKSLAVNLFNPKATQKTKLVGLRFQKTVCERDFGHKIKLFEHSRVSQ